MHEFKISTIRDTRDQLDLRVGTWRPAGGEVRGRILLMNGRTEWIEKYEYLPKEFGLPEDVEFVTWDHRGQGASGGARAYVNDYSDYDRDAAAVLKALNDDSVPYGIVAHSMGSLIALHATMMGFLQPKCMILASPLFGLPNEPVPRPIARPLAKLLTLAKMGAVSSGAGSHTSSQFESNRLTNNYDLFLRMRDNPYRIPGATFGWVTATFRAIDDVFNEEQLKKFSVPTMVIGGTEEKVVDIDAWRYWTTKAAQFSKAPIKLRMIPGGKHELFSEIPKLRQQAVGTAREFLKQHMPFGPSS